MSHGKEDFIHACRHAVEYFGGTPDAIVPDDLRSAVTKSSKYEPEINRSFGDFASHYSMSVLPARAYRPRDKALVECAVKIVYRQIFALLSDVMKNGYVSLSTDKHYYSVPYTVMRPPPILQQALYPTMITFAVVNTTTARTHNPNQGESDELDNVGEDVSTA